VAEQTQQARRIGVLVGLAPSEDYCSAAQSLSLIKAYRKLTGSRLLQRTALLALLDILRRRAISVADGA
jgi:hypothetical protein